MIFTEYEGPSSMHTTLLVESRDRGLPTASLWGHSPAYAQLSWNPRVSAGLAALLAKVLEIEVDLEPLQVAATYLDEALDKLARQNPQVQGLLRRLEESYGAVPEQGAALPPISDSVLREVEEILRRGESTPRRGLLAGRSTGGLSSRWTSSRQSSSASSRGSPSSSPSAAPVISSSSRRSSAGRLRGSPSTPYCTLALRWR